MCAFSFLLKGCFRNAIFNMELISGATSCYKWSPSTVRKLKEVEWYFQQLRKCINGSFSFPHRNYKHDVLNDRLTICNPKLEIAHFSKCASSFKNIRINICFPKYDVICHSTAPTLPQGTRQKAQKIIKNLIWCLLNASDVKHIHWVNPHSLWRNIDCSTWTYVPRP